MGGGQEWVQEAGEVESCQALGAPGVAWPGGGVLFQTQWEPLGDRAQERRWTDGHLGFGAGWWC